MGRLLRITIAVLLVVAVWAILVAPDYDLDPITVRAKLAITMLLCALLAATIASAVTEALRLLSRQDPSPPSVLSILDLTCWRLC